MSIKATEKTLEVLGEKHIRINTTPATLRTLPQCSGSTSHHLNLFFFFPHFCSLRQN